MKELDLVKELSVKTDIKVPVQIDGLGDRKVLHNRLCTPESMDEEILNILSEGK